MPHNKKHVLLHGITYKIVDIKNDSIWNYVEKLKDVEGKVIGYLVLESIAYESQRYKKWIGAEKHDLSDGATDGQIGRLKIKVEDIDSFCWIFHDELCEDGTFEDGTKCNNWQASHVLTDIMKIENYWFRANFWFWGTWTIGGDKARENGMF